MRAMALLVFLTIMAIGCDTNHNGSDRNRTGAPMNFGNGAGGTGGTGGGSGNGGGGTAPSR